MKMSQVCDEKSMPISGHLTELRRRILIVTAILVLGTGVSLAFARSILHWLQVPLLKVLTERSSFIALNPIEGWLVYFKVSLVSSLFITSPAWLYQLWAFVAPAIERHRRRQLVGTVILSSFLFIGGGLTCYFLILPYGFGYLASILEHTDIVLMPQIRLYLSFMLRIMIAFGLIFQVPLLTVLLARWNIVSPKTLRRGRKYIIVFSFIAAAIITPPDVVTQIILALPLILLFELSLFIANLLTRKNC